MGKKIVFIVIACLIIQTALLAGLNYVAFKPDKIEEPPPPPSLPNFYGNLGNLPPNHKFVDFLQKHDGQVVNIHARMDPLDQPNFYGHKQFVSAFDKPDSFYLWLELHEDSLDSFKPYSGVAINVNANGTDASYSYIQGTNILKGYWLIHTIEGLHQGDIEISLTGVSTLNALLLQKLSK